MLGCFPECLIRWGVRRRCRKTYMKTMDPRLRELYAQHITLNLSHHGPLSSLMNGTQEYPAFGKHPLQQADRLGNPLIDFPIAIVFGDSDFLGSEGSEELVRTSKFFLTGES